MCLIRRVGVYSILLLALGGILAYGQSLSNDQAQLLKLEEMRMALLLKGDPASIAKLGEMLTDDYLHVHSGGDGQDKATYLKGRAGGQDSNRGTLKVRIYGDVAIMTGPQFQNEKGKPPREMFVTTEWVRTGGTWKMAGYQATNKVPPRAP